MFVTIDSAYRYGGTINLFFREECVTLYLNNQGDEMDKYKFLSIALLCFSFIVLTNQLAFAERSCTRQVESSDGIKTITTDCSSSYTQTSDNFWNRFLFSTLAQNLKDNVQWGMQIIQDRLANIFSAQDHSEQIAAETKRKQQDAMEAQQTKREQAEARLEDLKERQEMQKERQQDLR